MYKPIGACFASVTSLTSSPAVVGVPEPAGGERTAPLALPRCSWRPGNLAKLRILVPHRIPTSPVRGGSSPQNPHGQLAGIRYHPDDPRRSDIDLWQRDITVRGKGGRPRIVKISYDAARAVDRYLRARARHPQAWRRQLWLGTGNRGPLTASGIYQTVTRRGRQCGVQVWPYRFRHHFSHTWLERGGPEGDLMELNGWSSPQMLARYGASARSARARRTYDRIMTGTP